MIKELLRGLLTMEIFKVKLIVFFLMLMSYSLFANAASIDNRIPIILPATSPYYSIQIRGPAIYSPSTIPFTNRLTVRLDTGTNTTHLPVSCFIKPGKNFIKWKKAGVTVISDNIRDRWNNPAFLVTAPITLMAQNGTSYTVEKLPLFLDKGKITCGLGDKNFGAAMSLYVAHYKLPKTLYKKMYYCMGSFFNYLARNHGYPKGTTPGFIINALHVSASALRAPQFPSFSTGAPPYLEIGIQKTEQGAFKKVGQLYDQYKNPTGFPNINKCRPKPSATLPAWAPIYKNVPHRNDWIEINNIKMSLGSTPMVPVHVPALDGRIGMIDTGGGMVIIRDTLQEKLMNRWRQYLYDCPSSINWLHGCMCVQSCRDCVNPKITISKNDSELPPPPNKPPANNQMTAHSLGDSQLNYSYTITNVDENQKNQRFAVAICPDNSLINKGGLPNNNPYNLPGGVNLGFAFFYFNIVKFDLQHGTIGVAQSLSSNHQALDASSLYFNSVIPRMLSTLKDMHWMSYMFLI